MNAQATLSAGALSILAVATAACPSEGSVPSTSVVTVATASRASVPGLTTAAQALAQLCEVRGQCRRDPVAPSGSVPAIVSSTEVQVAAARGHPFERAVAVEGVTPEVLDDRLLELFDASYPEDLYSRRSRAWATMDVIPDDYDLRKGFRQGTQRAVVEFYDPTSEALVYQGGGSNPGPDERFTLAHELTHALDDQQFDLLRLYASQRACLDDQDLAARSLSEGDAQYTAAKVAVDSAGMGSLLRSFVSQLAARPPIPGGSIPILADMSYVPYTDGLLFVQALVARGGTGEIDDAFAKLPISTPRRFARPTDGTGGSTERGTMARTWRS